MALELFPDPLAVQPSRDLERLILEPLFDQGCPFDRETTGLRRAHDVALRVNLLLPKSVAGVAPFLPVTSEKVAEREGFEPSVPLRARLISSQVQSTTLPPLRFRTGQRRSQLRKRKSKFRQTASRRCFT